MRSRNRAWIPPIELVFVVAFLTFVFIMVSCVAPEQPADTAGGTESTDTSALVFPLCEDKYGENWKERARVARNVSVAMNGRYDHEGGMMVAVRPPGELWCWFYILDSELDDALGR